MIDLPMGVIDKGIAFKLIEDRVPIRGAEVLFLRKAFLKAIRAKAEVSSLNKMPDCLILIENFRRG